jgi:hypothetical protein
VNVPGSVIDSQGIFNILHVVKEVSLVIILNAHKKCDRFKIDELI